MGTNMNRRSFLKGAALASATLAGSAALAGCAAKPEAKNAPKAQAAEGEQKGLTAEAASGQWAFEIPPAPIAEGDIAETIEADVVVVGAGTSGLIRLFPPLRKA